MKLREPVRLRKNESDAEGEARHMRKLRVVMAFVLAAALVVGVVGCSGLVEDLIDDFDDDVDDDFDDNGNGGIGLRIMPQQWQALTAQEQADGSFQVHARPLMAAGGAPFSDYTWTLASGSNFPPGTTVTPTTGVFSGSGNGLVAGETYHFQMVVTDGTTTASSDFQLTPLAAGGIPPTAVFQQWMGVPTIQLPDANADEPYGASLAVLAGTPPYSWFEDASYAGRGDFDLSGLVIDEVSGIVRGTLMHSAAGKTLRFRIVVRDHTGATAVTEPGGPVYEIVVR